MKKICGKTTEFGNSKVPDLASKFFGMVCCQISLKQCQLQAKEGSFLIVSREQSFVGRNEMEMNDEDFTIKNDGETSSMCSVEESETWFLRNRRANWASMSSFQKLRVTGDG